MTHTNKNDDDKANNATPCALHNDNSDAEEVLKNYIENISLPPKHWQRVDCCGSSRYVYCPECFCILIPTEDWPIPLKGSSVQLPFQVDVLLEDRRKSSTGVQLVSVLRALESCDDQKEMKMDASAQSSLSNYKLYDVDRNDQIPNYENQEGTYLLFPGEHSKPLSSLLLKNNNTTNNKPILRKLVLLDCTWTKSSLRLHKSVQCLPKVHLDAPPQQSFYWRWHNAGAGMLSTIEAVYYAAWDIVESLGWTLEERKILTNLLWLFSLQRSVILKKYTDKAVIGVNPHLPWTEEAKDFARRLRNRERREADKSRTENESEGLTS